VFRDSFDERGPSDENDRRTCAREHSAEVAADGASSHYCNLRPGLLCTHLISVFRNVGGPLCAPQRSLRLRVIFCVPFSFFLSFFLSLCLCDFVAIFLFLRS